MSTLHEVVERLAPLARRAGSEDEREAALWLAQRLEEAGAQVTVDDEEFLDGYARILAPLGGVGLAAGVLGASGRLRRVAAFAGLAAALALVDDASNGLRPWRRALAPKLPTQNVVARVGQEGATRTLVILAHHDAAPTGRIFDPSLQHWFGERFPGIVERIDTALPIWWPVAGGPLISGLGALTGRRRVSLAGALLSAAGAAAGVDIMRSPVVPGANDNLSACAVLVALAERLRDEPLDGDLRVLLVSCGAEEVLQGGIHGFARRHFPELPRESTWFLNLDTIGSPRLILVEGEGPFVMEDYCDGRFRDLVWRVAQQRGISLRRGMRARSSSDSVIPSRAGYPTAMLASFDRYKSLSNYHLMTDTPENLDYDTVADALALCEAVARELA